MVIFVADPGEDVDRRDQICSFDHCLGHLVKGLNLLNALYHCKGQVNSCGVESW